MLKIQNKDIGTGVKYVRTIRVRSNHYTKTQIIYVTSVNPITISYAYTLSDWLENSTDIQIQIQLFNVEYNITSDSNNPVRMKSSDRIE